MARLPQPGGDDGAWGDILNEYLSKSLSSNGSLKPSTVDTPNLVTRAVTLEKLAVSGSATAGKVLTYDGSGLRWDDVVAPTPPPVSDDSKQTVVRWNELSRTWGERPEGALFGVLFLSTNDPTASAPSSASLLVGDIWRRHPDA